MAIGDTVQAGLGRMDFSAFQTAGAAQARANEAFGNARAGGHSILCGEGKEGTGEGNRGELIRQGANPDSAKAISKNHSCKTSISVSRRQSADGYCQVTGSRSKGRRCE